MPVIRLQGDAERKAGIYYEVNTDDAPLGAGGMGQVYRGMRVEVRTGIRRPVAVKFLFDDLPPSAIERSRREASIHIQNENLVEMFGFIEVTDSTGATHYHVASELLEGVMLYDLLEGKTTDPAGNEVPFAAELYQLYQTNREAFATRVVKAVLSGVMAMHDMGYIHRDIDPSNIMVTVEGRIKLIDYGIAKKLNATNEPSLTSTGMFMGKAAYAAPELIVGDVAHQNETTDIYAIGIMLFQLLTGHLPFEGPQLEVQQMQIRKVTPVKEIANPSLRNIVARSTRKVQRDRYISASEFRTDIERAERGQRTSAGTDSFHGGGKKDNSGKKIAIIAAIGVGGLLLIGVLILVVIFIVGAMSDGSGDTYDDSDSLAYVADDGTQYILPQYGNIIDSPNDDAVTVDGNEYITVGRAVRLAIEEMDSNSAACIQQLREVVNTGYSSAANAAIVLAYIYFQENLTDAQISATSRYADQSAGVDMVMKAYELDQYNPEVLLCLGDLYYAGEGYTAGRIDRDMNKALQLYTNSRDLAEQSGNSHIRSVAEARLAQLAELGFGEEAADSAVVVVDSIG